MAILSPKELYKNFQAVLEKYCPGTLEFIRSLQTHMTLRKSGTKHDSSFSEFSLCTLSLFLTVNKNSLFQIGQGKTEFAYLIQTLLKMFQMEYLNRGT